MHWQSGLRVGSLKLDPGRRPRPPGRAAPADRPLSDGGVRLELERTPSQCALPIRAAAHRPGDRRRPSQSRDHDRADFEPVRVRPLGSDSESRPSGSARRPGLAAAAVTPHRRLGLGSRLPGSRRAALRVRGESSTAAAAAAAAAAPSTPELVAAARRNLPIRPLIRVRRSLADWRT